MKKLADLKYLKISVYAILVVAVSILIFRFSSTTDTFFPELFSRFGAFIGVFDALIAGLAIAYLMNPSMNFFERHLIKHFKPTEPKQYRSIRRKSIAIVYGCLFGAIYLFISVLIPQLMDNITFFVNNAQRYINNISAFLLEAEMYVNATLPVIPTEIVAEAFDFIDINSIIDLILNSLNTIFSTIVTSTVNLTGLLFDTIIAFIVALYVLGQKETFANGSTRFVYAVLKRDQAVRFLNLCKESHYMMIRFFVGKSLDSLIIGIICFFGLWLMNNPYALLLALILGVFNMIPYFGPFIGAIPAVLITLFEGIMPALLLIVFIIVIQQFDGLYLGPKILGDSLGITPFWIISSVTIGGGIAGAFGMFVACPIAAVIIIVTNRWIDKRLEQQHVYLPKLEAADVIPAPNIPYNKQQSPNANKENKENK
ncbi:MAG: hypothetical protein BEN18_07150 [Epulopiscium sp. Nuni2H_MBin001]|nr:MAG: hypothetical protein BEN18_07150 [Epulopiscium sp. Nuni2H_MBin001]